MQKILQLQELKKMPLWLIPMLYVGVTVVCGFLVPRLEHQYLPS
jgi:hypothetical protein